VNPSPVIFETVTIGTIGIVFTMYGTESVDPAALMTVTITPQRLPRVNPVSNTPRELTATVVVGVNVLPVKESLNEYPTITPAAEIFQATFKVAPTPTAVMTGAGGGNDIKTGFITFEGSFKVV